MATTHVLWASSQCFSRTQQLGTARAVLSDGCHTDRFNQHPGPQPVSMWGFLDTDEGLQGERIAVLGLV